MVSESEDNKGYGRRSSGSMSRCPVQCSILFGAGKRFVTECRNE